MNRNITHALLDVLRNIDSVGTEMVARGQTQKEVLSTLTKIANPRERFLVIPGRKNNVFAQLAETIWVLAGRGDLEFLQHYLPRSIEFSDDNKTWRAAYGPRLRNWMGKTDQVSCVISRLQEDPNTKRAVMSLFDPMSDYSDTKDVPCNNWLQFIQRDNILYLHVTVRANDAIWGFSGINFFEWSVLHEIVATTLGYQVGTLSWYVGTFHIYSRHYNTSRDLLRIKNPKSPYECGIEPTSIQTTLNNLDATLDILFHAESLCREGKFQDAMVIEKKLIDPFFQSIAIMLRIYNSELQGLSHNTVIKYLEDLKQGDFRVAAIEYLSRKWKDESLFYSVDKATSEFFNHYLIMQDDQRIE
ncbi:thymidylate synthase [Yersinia mollaretii]|uniref:thymidylate synthase n=1 Tax=Yersinia mollaretii TaxID=33060 RepID=UPI00119FB5FD|nr:thymidylate synthase [Yersinia mollaretii]